MFDRFCRFLYDVFHPTCVVKKFEVGKTLATIVDVDKHEYQLQFLGGVCLEDDFPHHIMISDSKETYERWLVQQNKTGFICCTTYPDAREKAKYVPISSIKSITVEHLQHEIKILTNH